MGRLALVGLGPGDPELLPPPSLALLAQAAPVFLRTDRHPAVPALADRGLRWTAFDDLWDGPGEGAVGRAVARVLEAARAAGPEETVALAVPGDPLLDDACAREALAAAQGDGLPVRVLPAPSLTAPVLAAAGGGPATGLQVVDAFAPALPPVLPGARLLVTHLRGGAPARVSRWLQEIYPPEHGVLLFRLALKGSPRPTGLSLAELAGLRAEDPLAILSVPPLPGEAGAAFSRFVQVVARLRAPGGCPWDRAQTHRSLRPYVVEEAYEVVDAIEAGDPARLAEELGDLLLQVALHGAIAAEAGRFHVGQVVEGITRKVIRRHPHVFGGPAAASPGEAEAGWEAIKRREKGEESALPAEEGRWMPALLEAEDLQSKAAGVGFDWPSAEQAWPKVREEIEEFRRAWQAGDALALEEELGDVLFALANVARLLGVNPELALKAANRKFVRRFRALERLAREEGRPLQGMTLPEMDRIWERVKAAERAEKG